MGVEWTSEQEQVINLRDRNLLVSAAAGSGKTAVLVERIISRITDKENPVDIDRILVVTFTKAAAAEMRERISNAIETLRAQNPEDENLERQATLIHNAQITTIDSFCLFVVRNHFGEINLDPNFRIADTGEIKLLENDVLAEVFAENYEQENNEAFFKLIDMYSGSRNDEKIRDMVSKIYHAAQSDSWPKKWIANLGRLYSVSSKEELVSLPIINGITEYVKTIISDSKAVLTGLMDIALEPDGPQKYLPTLEKDIELLGKAEELTDFIQLYDFFSEIEFSGLTAIRDKTVNPQKKEKVSDSRTEIKKIIQKLKADYFSIELDSLIEQLSTIQEYVDELIRLSIMYTDAVGKRKREKRIVDFGDIEHFALKIFVDDESGETTATAEEFREHFEEIMIDEYQDSNQVQEDIMTAISRGCTGNNNMFMVGDVKQSIYRFRLARPELFMHKYDSYSLSESKNQRIDLHKNFRSRKEVLNFSNDIFYKIMQTDMGKVAYDEASALYYGAGYKESDDKEAELLLVDVKDSEFAEIIEEEDSSIRVEALAVAAKIQDMMKNMQVEDKKTGQPRPMRYSDIVILFRGIKSCGDDFMQVLSECDIPAHVESQTGYFSAYEIQIVLSMLRILDNPLQDIPMTTVLKSPIVGLDEEELAEIRIKDRSKLFSELVMEEMEEATEGRLADFYNIYKEIRAMISDTPIHVIIQSILDRTGFGKYAAAMPAGERRHLNLKMLIERAIAYEKTSYKGLFHFIRYINQLQKYEVDFGEAETLGESDDVVRIMTIHKSKGLEFPVVFVSGLGRKINLKDAQDSLVLHMEYGIGIDEISGSPKQKKRSLIKAEIANQIKLENLGEELRVLYVALTRAKEKLILSGCISDATKTLQKYVGNVRDGEPISFSQRVKAGNYLDWIIPAMLSYPDKYTIDFISATELASRQAKDMAELTLDRAMLTAKIMNADEELIKKLIEKFDFEYKYKSELSRKSKYSVSELKHNSMLANYDQQKNEAEKPEFLKEGQEKYIPSFMQSVEAVGTESIPGVNPGALRGTAVHRVMECLDFKAILSIDTEDTKQVESFVESQIKEMISKKLLTAEMAEKVFTKEIAIFIQSPIAKRMAMADYKGLLFKEKPFVMSQESYLVQGIIDVFWIEDYHICVLDYKTDSVKSSEELIARYQTQLNLYADALARIFSNSGKKYLANESLIYSFKLKEVINL